MSSGAADGTRPIRELAEAAANLTDGPQLARFAALKVRELLACEGAGVALFERELNAFVVLGYAGPDGCPEPGQLAPRSAVVWPAFSRRRPTSTASYPSLSGADAALVGAGVRHLAAAPLVSGGEALGAVFAWSRRAGGFEAAAMKLLPLAAHHLGPALEAGRLRAQSSVDAARFQLLHEMAVATSQAPGPGSILTLAVSHARQVMDCDDATAVLWDEGQGAVQLAASAGEALATEDLPGPLGVMARAIARQEPVAVDDYPAWRDADPGAVSRGVKSAAAVPFAAGKLTRGVLAVSSLSPIQYNREQVSMLALLASQVAPALEGAALHAELAASEARYRAIYENVRSGIVLVNPDGRVQDANPTAERTLGYSLEEMRGRRPRELWQAEDGGGASVGSSSAEALASGRPVLNRKVRVRHREGGERWLLVDSVPMPRVAGKPSGVINNFLDLSSLTRTEAALRESEMRFRAVFDRAATGIARVGLDGRLIEVNPAFAELFGATQAELVGVLASELLGDEGYPAWALERVLGGEAKVTLDALSPARGGQPMWLSTVISLVEAEPGGSPFVILMTTDTTQRRAEQEALEKRALRDALTGLPNRLLLHDRLRQAIRMSQRTHDRAAVLMVDLDRFKFVNDNFGHEVGDHVLQAVARRLRDGLRESDTVGRLGGDEFAIVLSGLESTASALAAARKLARALEEPIRADSHTLEVSASIGVAVCPEHGSTAEQLLRSSDIAMYVAKRSGVGCALFSSESEVSARSRLALVGELRAAIDEGRLALAYQPQVDMKSRRVTAVEALVRWPHPTRGLVAPAEFVPLAEQAGLMKALTRWVLERSLAQLGRWREMGIEINLTVNLALSSLHDPDLPDTVAEICRRLQVDPTWLQVEVSEEALMSDPERAGRVIRRLDELGISVSVDDFGSAFSSLTVLRRLPIRSLKIDRSFVGEMTSDPNAAVIVRSSADLAHNLGLKVMAEGVERAPQWAMATAFGCDLAQGYLLGRPLDARRLTSWLKRTGLLPESVRRALPEDG